LLIHGLDPILETLASIKQRIPAINDLYNKMGPFDHSPKLSPNFEVFFIGRNLNIRVALLHEGQLFSPV
jgi:hypothetical protein